MDVLDQYKVDPSKIQEDAALKSIDTTVVTKESVPKISEDKIFPYLSEKLGVEVKSWDDLKKEKEVVKEVVKEIPLSYANDEIAGLDKYVRETGRGLNDYIKLQKDWGTVPDEKIVEEYLRTEHPEYTDEEIAEMASLTFGKIPLNEEEMDEEKISDIKRENRKRELALKSYVAKARSFFESEKEKFKTPAERKKEAANEGEKAWEDSMGKTIESLNSIEVGDFKYDIPNKSKYSHLINLQKLIDSFKKEDGSMNFDFLARTIITGLEANSIIEEHAKFVESNTREMIMKEYSNKGGILEKIIDPTKLDIDNLRSENLKKLKQG